MFVRCEFISFIRCLTHTKLNSVCIIGFCWGADYYKAKPLFSIGAGALGTIFFIIVTCVTAHMVQYVSLILAFGCVCALPPLVSTFLIYKTFRFFDNIFFLYVGPYLGRQRFIAPSRKTWCGYRRGECLGMLSFYLWSFPLAQPGRS